MTAIVQIPEAFDLTKYKRCDGFDDDNFGAGKQLGAFCKRLDIPEFEEADGTFVWIYGRVRGRPTPNVKDELTFTLAGPTWATGNKIKTSRCIDVGRKLGLFYRELESQPYFGFNNTASIYGAVASDAQGRFLDVFAIDPSVPIRNYEVCRIYSPKVVLALELHQ